MDSRNRLDSKLRMILLSHDFRTLSNFGWYKFVMLNIYDLIIPATSLEDHHALLAYACIFPCAKSLACPLKGNNVWPTFLIVIPSGSCRTPPLAKRVTKKIFGLHAWRIIPSGQCLSHSRCLSFTGGSKVLSRHENVGGFKLQDYMHNIGRLSILCHWDWACLLPSYC